MKMIPQLIRELFHAGEYPAARELSISYLRQKEDEDIRFLLAGIFHEEKKYKEALECIEKVPLSDIVLIHKAKILYYLQRAPEAEAILRSLPKKWKKDEGYIVDLGLYMTSQGKLNQTRKLIAPIADTNNRASFNYGWHLLAEDKFQEGYKYIRAGAIDELRVWGHEWILRKEYNIGEQYRWKLGDEVDTIAFYLEGGMGDGMIFVRYVEHFKKYCKTVKIFTPKQLMPLLGACGFENLYEPEQIVKTKWDKYVPAMSAPYFLGLDDPMEGVTFPYFKKRANPVPEMNRVANGKKKICIRWKGSSQFEHEQFRSIPIEKMLGLEKFGQLFSVQLEDSDIPKNANVWDLAPSIKTWNDTYDIFEESDLIITSCTSTAHLAGAMGARVIVLPPLLGYVTWETKDIRWYPDNVVVLQQMEYNSWDKTIDKLYEMMENWEW
tara:strand:+ start:5533 stop:6843 length:1311 start_codon:yes stop_codon:yes gene_type:complete